MSGTSKHKPKRGEAAAAKKTLASLFAMLALAACGGGSGSGATSIAVPLPAPTGIPVTLTIGSQVAGAASLTPATSGLSFEKNQLSKGLFSAGSIPLIALFKQLGPSVLRIGGSSVNTTTWDDSGDANGRGMTVGYISPTDVDRLADFLNATGWKVIYGINFATASTAQMSSEAAYVKTKLGDRLAGFELGNEPDLYASNGLRPSGYTFNQFITEWNADAASIRSVVPAPAFAGPASSYNYKQYTIPFTQGVGAGAQLVTQHYYINSSCPDNATGYAPSISGMLATDPNLPNELQALVATSVSNHVSGGVRMAEANSYYSCATASAHLSGAPGVSNAFASALWAMDFLMTNARYGISGVNFHSGGSAYYSPIQTNAAAVASVQPEYYGLWLFGQTVDTPSGTLMEAPISMNNQPSLPIKAYDVLARDGSHRVLILNESSSDINVSVQQLPANATTAALSLLRATGGLADTTAGDVSVNGSHLRADGTWDSFPTPTAQAVAKGSTIIHVPAASALLALIH